MAGKNGSLWDIVIDFLIDNIVHLLGFLLGVSAKWATRYKSKQDNYRDYIYDGVIAAAATFLSWQVLKSINRLDLAPVGIFVSARYGDAIINLIWLKIKEVIAAKKIDEKENTDL